jgi:hypothetical protein
VSEIRSRDSFRGDGPLEAWVWRAAVNAARKATRRPLVDVSGLLMGIITGLVAFQGGDMPLIRRASPILNMPLADGVGPGLTPSDAKALAVVSACVAAVALIAAGVILE